MEETFVCSRCGCAVPQNEAVRMDDDILCPECAETVTFLCDCCGNRTWSNDDYGDGEVHLCRDCRDDHYVSCANCGELIPREDACFEEDGDDEAAYCTSCYERFVTKAIRSYSYKPSPIFYGEGPLYLGVELEVDEGGKNNHNAKRILELFNQKEEKAYMKGDGSLDDGMELVSHPASLDYQLHQMPWEQSMALFREMGYYSHSAGTCGLHVHVSRAGLGETEAAQEDTVAKLLYLFERFWQEVLRFSRRTESQMNRWAARYGYKNSGHEILKAAKYAGSGRYSAINLLNEDTIEFRAFRGTLKYNTFAATLQFVANLCRVAVSLSEEELERMGWPDLVCALTSEDTPELIQYLKERQLYVNEPVVAAAAEV